MEKDVVCGMQVDPAKAAGSSEYNGKTVLLLLQGLQDEVRGEPRPIRQVAPALRRLQAMPSQTLPRVSCHMPGLR